MTSPLMALILSFRELRSFPGSAPSILLSLFDPRIPCQKAGLFQSSFIFFVNLKKSFRYAVADGDRLSRDSSAMNIDLHIELGPGSGQFERLYGHHFTGFPAEIVLHRPLIHEEFSLSRLEPYPRYRILPFTCRINGLCHVFLSPLQISRGTGFCASWG
jgi:hypothetical protein